MWFQCDRKFGNFEGTQHSPGAHLRAATATPAIFPRLNTRDPNSKSERNNQTCKLIELKALSISTNERQLHMLPCWPSLWLHLQFKFLLQELAVHTTVNCSPPLAMKWKTCWFLLPAFGPARLVDFCFQPSVSSTRRMKKTYQSRPSRSWSTVSHQEIKALFSLTP